MIIQTAIYEDPDNPESIVFVDVEAEKIEVPGIPMFEFYGHETFHTTGYALTELHAKAQAVSAQTKEQCIEKLLRFYFKMGYKDFAQNIYNMSKQIRIQANIYAKSKL